MFTNLRGREYQKYVLNIMALYKQRPDLKAYLELLLSLMTVAFLTIFAIKPTVVTIGDLLTKINSEQITSDQLNTKIKNLGVAQKLYNSNTGTILLLNQAVPTNPDVATYIRQTEGALNRDQVKPVNITVGEVSLTAATESGLISVTTSSSGTYTSLTSFLKDVESLLRPAFIAKLDLVNLVQEGAKTLNLTVTAHAPYK